MDQSSVAPLCQAALRGRGSRWPLASCQPATRSDAAPVTAANTTTPVSSEAASASTPTPITATETPR